MATLTDKFILSEASALRRIKLHQYKLQILPVVLIMVSFILGSNPMLYIQAVVLAALGAGLFLLIGTAPRYKQRLPIPEANMFVSPIQGMLRYTRGNEDTTVVNIARIFLDSVEIRSPHPDAVIEDAQLRVPSPHGSIMLRFNKTRVTWFAEPDFTRGNVIGMIWGHGSCTISIPSAAIGTNREAAPEQMILPKVGKPLDICEALFALPDPEKPEAEQQPAERDILVKEGPDPEDPLQPGLENSRTPNDPDA